MMYRCFHCNETTQTYKEIINHLIRLHPDQEIKLQRVDGTCTKLINYKVCPELCREQGRIITLDEESEKLHVSRRNVIPKDSPMKKLLRFKSNLCEDENADEGTLQELDIDINNESDSFKDLVGLLPGVIESLKKCDKLEDFISFNKLVCDGKFPVDNIAFLLFLDVVRWFSLEKSTTLMRYSDECKLFWSTGVKLFRGRFLRFMGGPKNRCQTNDLNESPGIYSAEHSSVNFAVPDRRMLKDECRIVPVEKPGIIHKMIETVSANDPKQILTYKICVDGKKINPTSTGVVNLWGYEPNPTFEMKRNRLQQELELLKTDTNRIERQMGYGYIKVNELNNTDQEMLAHNCRKAVTVISNRIKDLRVLKVGKEAVLKKLQIQCEGGDWRNSNFAMVISSLRTNIYQIENCIDDMLNINESLCKNAAIAAQNDTLCYPTTTDEVSLGNQQNYVCLGSTPCSEVHSSLIKQRSERWFELRKKCLVTGSTINKAIGLEGLKKQKLHIDTKAGRKEAESITEELQNMFDYGTKNELNAVATLSSTFVPAFHPDALLYEEGCYVKKENGVPYLVVSPDGSLRKHGMETSTIASIEIKCPMPGKVYTTPIHYTLPHYYVPQVLSEMDSLGVTESYFVSYSKESTAVHLLHFEDELWNDICNEIKQLDIQKTPKKLGSNVQDLKRKIDSYRHTKMSLVAEIKSKTAKACEHPPELSGRIRHASETRTESSLLLKNAQKVFIRANDVVQTCHKLCCQKASEVLVFLLADLDRVHKLEVPHAFPVAYAFKGYSMKAESMRKMIQDVLNALYLQGLYTPVVSYDGQWASLAFRAEDGYPLTLLELQKQVYNEVKSRKKCDLTEVIFKTGVVNSNTLNESADQIQYRYDEVGKAVEVALKPGPKLFRTSSHIQDLLRKQNKSARNQQVSETDEPEETGTDHIFSSISGELMVNLDDTEIQSISHINSETAVHYTENSESHQEPIDISDTILFTDEINDDVHEQTASEENGVTSLDHDVPQVSDLTEIVETKPDDDKLLSEVDVNKMLCCLKSDGKYGNKWTHTTTDDFEKILQETETLMKRFSKQELIMCLQSVADVLLVANMRYGKSWNKHKLAELLHSARNKRSTDKEVPSIRRRRRTPDKLVILCKRTINKISKPVLNAVIAEHTILDRVTQWRETSHFASVTEVCDEKISWFSVPEYNNGTLSYIFSYLDVHHLITNCRVKVCKDGIPARGINKQAWIFVAKSNKTKLKPSHVEDLVDKQSDSIARETFSEEVEKCMSLQYPREAKFCKLIREFYEAEDDPGLNASERCVRRIALRTWLLDGVNFCSFPPYGTHINGIPNVMFQGFLTNIDRRLQLFPYTKSGSYNVRALGSLEAENLFGQFQDLDSKGTGVVKAEEVPNALEAACQLLRVKLLPDRPFHMSLSRAKVYPLHELLPESDVENKSLYVYPSFVRQITVRDHMFDAKARAKRKARRRIVEITGPDQAARGVSGVRQFHKCDESKILAHKRLGIDL